MSMRSRIFDQALVPPLALADLALISGSYVSGRISTHYT
jgi:hypothetical protein